MAEVNVFVVQRQHLSDLQLAVQWMFDNTTY